jgi:predicted DNA-binding transcriptional regulator YafY
VDSRREVLNQVDGHPGKNMAKYLGVSRATLYRYLSSERAAQAPYAPGVDR